MTSQQSSALAQALAWITAHYHVVGIVASGSIIRGNPNPGSDFDIYVIHTGAFRQRVQRFFNGVPCELFINTFAQTYEYFEREASTNRPVSAHMLATGQVVWGHDHPALLALVQAARHYAALAPALSDEQLLFRTYGLATLVEDAADSIASEPATAAYILDKAAAEMLELLFLVHHQPLPRLKERLQRLLALAPLAGQLLTQYYSQAVVGEKLALLTKLLAAMPGGKTGFFEWSSAPAPCSPD